MILRTTIGAFVAAQETADAIEAMREDRLFLRSTLVVQQGGINAALTYLKDHETPPVLVVETEARGDQLFGQLEQLAEVCDPGTRVFVVGRDNDITIYRTLIREGVTDYLVGPVDAETVRDSFYSVFTEADAAEAGRLIVFTPARGGVGSSILAHHTAFALARDFEEQVVVLDMDLAYGTAALVFNMQARQTMADALSQTTKMDEVLLERFLIPYEPSENRVSVLPSPASLGTGVQIKGDHLNAMLKIVRNMAGFVVIDLPHLWDNWNRDLIVAADDLVIVAEPDLANLRDAKNLVEFLGPNRGGDAPTRVVLNKLGGNKKAELSEKEFKDALGFGPSAQIPADYAAFGTALNNGELVFKTAGKSKAVEAINGLAKLVSGRTEQEEGEGKGKKKLSLFKKKPKKK